MSVSQEETLLHAHTIPISLPISNPSRPELGQNRAWNERTVKLTPNYGFLRPMKLEAGSIGGFKISTGGLGHLRFAPVSSADRLGGVRGGGDQERC